MITSEPGRQQATKYKPGPSFWNSILGLPGSTPQTQLAAGLMATSGLAPTTPAVAAGSGTAAADTAASTDAAKAASAGGASAVANAGSTLLKNLTLKDILGGLLAWHPKRMLELLIGVVLLFMGIKTITGIGPTALIK